MSPSFDRATPRMGYSLAFYGFRRDFTQLNEHYWAHLPARIIASAALKGAPASTTIQSVTGSVNPDLTRCGHDVAEWQRRARESENWTRLSALIMMLSALEVYLNSAVRAAIASDPLRIPGFPKRVDGIALLKLGRLDVQSERVERIVKGEWGARAAAYEETFGRRPSALTDNVASLDQMRVLRNHIAHEAGRSGSPPPNQPGSSYSGLRAIDKDRLSEKRLQKFLDILFRVAKGIDSHLCTDFIGDWEMLELHHYWNHNRGYLEDSLGSRAIQSERRAHNGVVKFLARTTGIQAGGSTYFREMDRYYRTASV